jgi:ribonuclease P protein component
MHVVRASEPTLPTVGFVVGKSVGNSVVRHRVTRRLRAIIAVRLNSLPAGSATVVRALPSAAQASSAALSADIDSALARLVAGARVAGSRTDAQ